jgi:LDH2 family malate/lactate/ureidoglycolate dehydrogenase
MTDHPVYIKAEALQTFTQEVFTRAGLPPEDAAIEAEVLVWANLRGVDSHGVLRIPWYLAMLDKGVMNPRPNIEIISESPAVLYMEADRALGPIATVQAMKLAVRKATENGIGWALIRNVTHQGAMAYYALMAAEAGLAGLAIVCSPPNMAPFGARAAGVHNSPIAIAVPAQKHPPLVLDMATSVAAGGKISLAQDKGIPLPLGWALDSDGNPTTDAGQARILLPAGGPKGSGLAMMFQCLTSLMANNPLIVPALTGQLTEHNQNSVVAAINIGFFIEATTYKKHVDEMIDQIKALPKIEGVAEIMVPGEPEYRTLSERTQRGIPLPPGTVQKLRDTSARFGIPLPAGIEGG